MGDAALFTAVRSRHEAAVELLLASGADLNTKWVQVGTPLLISAESGNIQIA